MNTLIKNSKARRIADLYEIHLKTTDLAAFAVVLPSLYEEMLSYEMSPHIKYRKQAIFFKQTAAILTSFLPKKLIDAMIDEADDEGFILFLAGLPHA